MVSDPSPTASHFERQIASFQPQIQMGDVGMAAVRTAVPLTDAQQAMILRRLEAHVGQPLRARFEVDPGLLGGVQARVGDRLIDDTILARLAALREALIKSGESI